MILTQLVDSRELEQLSPQDLRELILRLDEQIAYGTDETLLVSIQANVVGVRDDRPAGDPEWRQRREDRAE